MAVVPLCSESKTLQLSRAGFFLKTHDFLQPLERPSSPAPHQPAAEKPLTARHALPGGVGTFTISRPAAADLPAAVTAVKQEPAFALWGQPEPRGTLLLCFASAVDEDVLGARLQA